MSVYIHIPFCSRICSYCDFPKIIKNEKLYDLYLNQLECEIAKRYRGEVIDTLYIGGGTPTSLDIKSLIKLFNIVNKMNISNSAEITIEANTEDLSDEKLILLRKYVNRLSIGVQTFNRKILNSLNRTLNIRNLKKSFKYFKNINLDLMYGFSGQTFEDLKSDLDEIIRLNPTHISAYSLIIEPNTLLMIKNYEKVDEQLEREMYDYIVSRLKECGYNHYEISNFSMEKYESKHNLTYWDNERYYGFGLGASGYLGDERYENTRSLTRYLNGDYLLSSHVLNINEKLQNEFMLGFRKIKGIDKKIFSEKYGFDIRCIKEVDTLLNQKLLIDDEHSIFISPKYLYTSNEILVRLIDVTLPNV